jgi:murein DD-endopeptidase MepM/ murein hydrolase activator NlpD
MAGSGIAYQPVRATHNGYVASYRDGIPEGQGGGFGNYVRLVGSTSGGEVYYTTYAHFRNVSPRVVSAYDALRACMSTPLCTTPPTEALIAAGTVLGWVDHTGYSTNHHLHYQYNGPGTLQLPMGCGGWSGTCPAN